MRLRYSLREAGSTFNCESAAACFGALPLGLRSGLSTKTRPMTPDTSATIDPAIASAPVGLGHLAVLTSGTAAKLDRLPRRRARLAAGGLGDEAEPALSSPRPL